MNEQFTATSFKLHNQHLNELRRRASLQQTQRPAQNTRAALWTTLSAWLRSAFNGGAGPTAQATHRKAESTGKLARTHS